ncbi:hypothetical protein ZIOFF_000621 [Zingiber officinale]|uniref:WRKY domain-containing protein n=2 Tax=Zingiber officinale TaxID=94328 RepID=A0A8J5I4Q5_ZINOF|nr:hypothetical protein ZIOFF_000621 [Zingiber officinale]
MTSIFAVMYPFLLLIQWHRSSARFMEAALSQILDACKLAKELEGSLLFQVDVASDAHYLLGSCEEIVGAFNRAIQGLYTLQNQSSCSVQMLLMSACEGTGNPLCAGMPAQRSLEIQPAVTEFAGGSSYVYSAASSAQRGGRCLVQKSSKKRKEGTLVKLVPAHPNMENAPDDGYTWKKYGQKVILNSRFQRSYYHCTHKNHYGCKGKKKVQRLDDDPSTLEVTYCGAHTCRTSPTPIMIPNELMPSAVSNSKNGENNMQTVAPETTLIQLRNWFNRDSSNRYIEQMQGGRDIDYSVAEFADAMFNSGSSSSTLDVIFTQSQGKLQALDPFF